jgi:molecular chaperone HtpG
MVKDVKASSRLLESPACIVADENDPTAQLQQMMKALGQDKNMPEIKPILEINPRHDIIQKLQDISDAETIKDISMLLLDQALLVENVPIKDPAGFAARMNKYLSRSFK